MILSRGQFNNVSFFANKHPFVLFFQNVYQGFIVKILNISSLKKKKLPISLRKGYSMRAKRYQHLFISNIVMQ